MKKICICDSLIEVERLRGELARAGIDCVVKNEHLFGALGQLPAKALMPELWVLGDADAEAARRIVTRERAQLEVPGRDWDCPDCGERLEAQFQTCWNCAAPRPEP